MDLVTVHFHNKKLNSLRRFLWDTRSIFLNNNLFIDQINQVLFTGGGVIFPTDKKTLSTINVKINQELVMNLWI